LIVSWCDFKSILSKKKKLCLFALQKYT